MQSLSYTEKALLNNALAVAFAIIEEGGAEYYVYFKGDAASILALIAKPGTKLQDIEKNFEIIGKYEGYLPDEERLRICSEYNFKEKSCHITSFN